MSDTTPQPSEETIATAADTMHLSELRDTPHAVAAGRGIGWLTEGWALIMKEPAVFVAMSVISLVAIFILNLIPLLGSLASALLWPAMMAGFFLAFRHAKRNESVTANDLFEPFKAPASLIGVGGIYLIASLILMLILGVVAFLSIGSIAAFTEGHIDITRMGTGLVILLLIAIPSALALAMAFVFAPVLVHQHQIPVTAAIKRSFAGSKSNILPFIVLFILSVLLFMILSLFMAIPLIGWLVTFVVTIIYLPLLSGALFCAYNDIFLQSNSSEL